MTTKFKRLAGILLCSLLPAHAAVAQTQAPIVESAATLVYAVSFVTGELISFETGDPSGTRQTLLHPGSLVSPASLAIGPDGNLYIGENGDGSTFAPRISKY